MCTSSDASSAEKSSSGSDSEKKPGSGSEVRATAKGRARRQRKQPGDDDPVVPALRFHNDKSFHWTPNNLFTYIEASGSRKQPQWQATCCQHDFRCATGCRKSVSIKQIGDETEEEASDRVLRWLKRWIILPEVHQRNIETNDLFLNNNRNIIKKRTF